MLNMKKNNYLYKIENIKLFGFHGVYDTEIANGQNFYISISYMLSVDYVKNDNVNDNIDYIRVISTVDNVFNAKRYNLIENLACDIHLSLKDNFNFNNVKVSVKKKNLSIDNKVDFISVQYPNE